MLNSVLGEYSIHETHESVAMLQSRIQSVLRIEASRHRELNDGGEAINTVVDGSVKVVACGKRLVSSVKEAFCTRGSCPKIPCVAQAVGYRKTTPK